MITSNLNINYDSDFGNNYNSKGLDKIYEFNQIYKSYKGVLKEFEPVVFNLKELLSLNEDDFHNLVIILTEAFNNAVSHGNNYDEKKDVEVSIIVFSLNLQTSNNKSNVVEITMTDEGDGFDIDKIEDPREPKNLLKDGGRGVFLIKELSNSITYKLSKTKNKNLNTLQIYFEY